jgi:hypothetical protein
MRRSAAVDARALAARPALLPQRLRVLPQPSTWNVELEDVHRREADWSIVLPRFETFRDTESYYATLVDETMHWTGQLGRQV